VLPVIFVCTDFALTPRVPHRRGRIGGKVMFKSTKKGNSVLLPVLFWAAAALFILVPVFFGPVADSEGWSPISNASAAAIPTPEALVYTGYKGVTIGMSMDEARAKLGKPRDMSDVEDYYVYSETETCQVQYDVDKTVKNQPRHQK
jgi:hypothetical protein